MFDRRRTGELARGDISSLDPELTPPRMVSPHEPRPLVAKGAKPGILGSSYAAGRESASVATTLIPRLFASIIHWSASSAAATASLTTPRYRSRAVCRTRASTASGTSAVSRCLSLRSEACAGMVPEWYRLGTTSRRVLSIVGRSTGHHLPSLGAQLPSRGYRWAISCGLSRSGADCDSQGGRRSRHDRGASGEPRRIRVAGLASVPGSVDAEGRAPWTSSGAVGASRST